MAKKLLEEMADAEDAAGSVSVGGLAVDAGLYPGAILTRPECPFNYCDQPKPYEACKEGCRHRIRTELK